jgi:HAE1 family hydrophobic/amphiphilic exporter-1
MTSFAFILGVVPLLIAFGPGAASQRDIGTVVFGGMLSSTLLAIPFVPVFYVAMERLSKKRVRSSQELLVEKSPDDLLRDAYKAKDKS